MSSRLEDLRELGRMLDDGKITQREYDIVKKELLEAPAEEWAPSPDESPTPDLADETTDQVEVEPAGWWGRLASLSTTYRAAVAGAVLVLVAGSFVMSRTDAAGSVTALPQSDQTTPEQPPADSLGIDFPSIAERWNEVDEAPLISGGISTVPEPGPLDSFLYKFNDSALLAGAYDPTDDAVYALLARSNLQYQGASTVYIHLCHLLHPTSQDCLSTFLEETGLFGRAHQELIGSTVDLEWDLGGQTWSFQVSGDVETIRVQAPGSP